MQERPALADAEKKALVDLGRFGGAVADFDVNARRPQLRMAQTLHPRIGIFDGRHDPGDTGLGQRVGAGRRPALVGAGLERHIDRGTAGSVPRRSERFGLGMRPAAVLGAAATNDVAVLDDDAPYGRIGPGAPERSARQRERRAHHRINP
jgi:hypothetical protein